MSTIPHAPASPGPVLPRIELTRFNGSFIVSATPRHGTRAPAFAPFPLGLPNSLLDWLLVLGEHAWRGGGRYLAVTLLLDTHLRSWLPLIPRQTAGPDGVSWRVGAEDLVRFRPEHAIAGSFQTRPDDSFEVLAGVVPPLPGLHVVQGNCGGERRIRLFIRHGESCELIQPEAVLVNDWQQTLAQHANRLKLA